MKHTFASQFATFRSLHRLLLPTIAILNCQPLLSADEERPAWLVADSSERSIVMRYKTEPRMFSEVERLIHLLDAPAFETREDASKALKLFGAEAIHALVCACIDPSPERAARAFDALKTVKLNALRQRLASSSETERQDAWELLQREGLPDGSDDFRSFLRTLRGKAFNAFFADRLFDTSDIGLRQLALEHLKIVGESAQLEAVLFAVELDYRSSNSLQAPWAALSQVAQSKECETMQRLRLLSAVPPGNTEAPIYHQQTCSFLQNNLALELPATGTLNFETLRETVNDRKSPEKAAKALRMWWLAHLQGSTTQRNFSVESPGNEVELRALKNMADALTPTEKERLTPWIEWPFRPIDLFHDERPEIRKFACETVLDRFNMATFKALTERLEDPLETTAVRLTAIATLGRLLASGQAAAREPLIAALEWESKPEVLRALAFALARYPAEQTAALLLKSARQQFELRTIIHLRIAATVAAERWNNHLQQLSEMQLGN